MMKRIKKFSKCFVLALLTGFTLISAGGCAKSSEAPVGNSYAKEIKEFRDLRLQRLKARDGWLSLAGLFWLEEGENTFGGSEEADFVLEKKNLPPVIGTFILGDASLRFKAAEGVSVTVEGGGEINGEMPLLTDETAKPTLLSHQSLSWFIIKRGDKLGVRVRDAENPRIAQLTSIDTFPIEKEWRIEATFEKYQSPRMIKTPTAIGTIDEQPSPGVLVFTVKGNEFKLHPIGGEGDLFIVFGDETNTVETYGGGRFLTVKQPDVNGRTFIDFNRAINPPCMFSPYATCPLPPEENILPFQVRAGEKMVKGLGH